MIEELVKLSGIIVGTTAALSFKVFLGIVVAVKTLEWMGVAL